MKDYEKPVVTLNDEAAEGVYAASGSVAGDSSDGVKRCRFGRTGYNPGADTCQGCSASGGTSSDGTGRFKEDFAGCPDNMPSSDEV